MVDREPAFSVLRFCGVPLAGQSLLVYNAFVKVVRNALAERETILNGVRHSWFLIPTGSRTRASHVEQPDCGLRDEEVQK
jgi:hypothetical protein